jgi:hypothetical protein
MTSLISEHYSEDKIKYAAVFARGDSYRVLCLDSYFETQKELYFQNLDKAEDSAEDWILNE